MLFLGVGFAFLSLYLLDAVSMLQDVLTCTAALNGDLPHDKQLLCPLCGVRLCVQAWWVIILGRDLQSSGAGDSGLPNSPHPRAPQRPSRKVCLGHMALVEIDMV